MATFDAKKMTRNRCIGWDPKGDGGKGAGIYAQDYLDAKGNVDTAACSKDGINPALVKLITVADLPGDYANGPKAALTKLASEWSNEKDKWTPDEVAHYLALSARMQDEANESVKRHRPVTDRAAERAASTMTKILRAQGKSEAEITAALKAVGMAR
jgi:hypothetical protein